MQLNVIKSLKKQSREYGVPLWQLPDVILIFMALVNITVILITYYWSSSFSDDPREAVLIVSFEAILILFISDILVKSAKKIICSEKMEKEFASIITHQVKNPLTSVKWSLEMMATAFSKERSQEERKKYLNRAITENEKAIDLLNNIIDAFRLKERAPRYMKKEIIQLYPLLKERTRKAEIFAKANNVSLRINIVPNRRVVVNLDPEMLKVVLDNLIDNAIKYSDSGTTIYLKATVNNKKRKVVLSVSNKGLLISEEERELIFKKFYRTQEAKKNYTVGTGLGLFICQTILSYFKGKIWVEVDGKNNRNIFFVELPMPTQKQN